MKARKKYVYEYYIANWRDGMFAGESSTIYSDYKVAKESLLSDYSSQHRLEEGTFETIDYWDEEYARPEEEGPRATTRMFEYPTLYVHTRTEFASTPNFTERAIFKKEIK